MLCIFRLTKCYTFIYILCRIQNDFFVLPTYRPKSACNRCVIEIFCGVFVFCFWSHRTESDLFPFLLQTITASQTIVPRQTLVDLKIKKKETSTKMNTSFLIGFNIQYGPYSHFGYVILISDLMPTKCFETLKNGVPKVPKQVESKRDDVLNPINYNFNPF